MQPSRQVTLVEIDRALVAAHGSRRFHISRPRQLDPTPVIEMPRLRAALGCGPRLLVKRDDLISFGGGGNKVRKIEMVAARALAEGADTLISTGGVQSNHARVVAAVAARLGMSCVFGCERLAAARRPDRQRAPDAALRRPGRIRRHPRGALAQDGWSSPSSCEAAGRRPFIVPLGRVYRPWRARLRPAPSVELLSADRATGRYRRSPVPPADPGRPRRPAAWSSASRHGSSASARMTPPTTSRKSARTAARSRPGELLGVGRPPPRTGPFRARRRRLRRHRLRHTHAGLGRGRGPRSRDRRAGARSGLHRQGDGGLDRLRARRPLLARVRRCCSGTRAAFPGFFA